MEHLFAQLVDVSQQAVPPVPSGFGPDGWKVISGLSTFIGGLILWIRELQKEVNKVKDERIIDLQHNLEVAREDKTD